MVLLHVSMTFHIRIYVCVYVYLYVCISIYIGAFTDGAAAWSRLAQMHQIHTSILTEESSYFMLHIVLYFATSPCIHFYYFFISFCKQKYLCLICVCIYYIECICLFCNACIRALGSTYSYKFTLRCRIYFIVLLKYVFKKSYMKFTLWIVSRKSCVCRILNLKFHHILVELCWNIICTYGEH